MEKRVLCLAALSVLVALACGDDKAGGAAGAAGQSTAGGMAVTGTSGTGTGAAGGGAAGTMTGASGSGAAGTGTAGRAAAGTGAAGMSAAGTGAAGAGAAGAGAAGTGAAGTGAGGAAAGSGGASGAAAGAGGAASGGGTFALTSSAVQGGQMLPAKHRCTGSVGGPTGPNPPLAWSGAPAGTMSFAVILRDRTFNDYQHWTMYDIPASVTSLPEGVPAGAMPAMPSGAKQASNATGLTGPGYYGPCGGMNMYEFKVYALDVAMLPMPGMTGASVERVLEMHDLATASLTVMSAPP